MFDPGVAIQSQASVIFHKSWMRSSKTVGEIQGLKFALQVSLFELIPATGIRDVVQIFKEFERDL